MKIELPSLSDYAYAVQNNHRNGKHLSGIAYLMMVVLKSKFVSFSLAIFHVCAYDKMNTEIVQKLAS